MKRTLLALSRSYLAALQKYLQQSAELRSGPACGLGEAAVALGVETLELARIHEKALAVILDGAIGRTRKRIARRAAFFFAEVNVAIEKTHVPASEATNRLEQLSEKLNRRTQQLAASKRELKRGIVARKAAHEDFKKCSAQTARLLEESCELQDHLRELTRQIFATQEEGRQMLSGELHEEVAQTLLEINVRLITLKHGAVASATRRTEHCHCGAVGRKISQSNVAPGAVF
jgi:signal transduction histidine kinase